MAVETPYTHVIITRPDKTQVVVHRDLILRMDTHHRTYDGLDNEEIMESGVLIEIGDPTGNWRYADELVTYGEGAQLARQLAGHRPNWRPVDIMSSGVHTAGHDVMD